MEVPVPAKIVIVGTSKMSLDERFSQLPLRQKAPVPVRYRSKEHDYREPEQVQYMSDVDLKEVEEDAQQYVHVQYVSPRRKPRAVVWRPLSVQERVQFPAVRNYVNRNRTRRGTLPRTNATHTPFNRDGWHVVRGGVRRGRGKGRGGRGRGTFPKRTPISREQLDRELDAYMKRSKHPHIDAYGLMQA